MFLPRSVYKKNKAPANFRILPDMSLVPNLIINLLVAAVMMTTLERRVISWNRK
jgi:hypothetical protein